ncbi:uncharacterized protein LOC125178947 [Hyalella azteca]|uniref:Uncharacterized protein LOC125178947 n=1 Tax=Hyalella azteca TaxID=294128 RepID=A0A979FT85_HYAAZ|nr:uncharacterized protein LOC125178947 [Hyalella azteca]
MDTRNKLEPCTDAINAVITASDDHVDQECSGRNMATVVNMVTSGLSQNNTTNSPKQSCNNGSSVCSSTVIASTADATGISASSSNDSPTHLSINCTETGKILSNLLIAKIPDIDSSDVSPSTTSIVKYSVATKMKEVCLDNEENLAFFSASLEGTTNSDHFVCNDSYGSMDDKSELSGNNISALNNAEVEVEPELTIVETSNQPSTSLDTKTCWPLTLTCTLNAITLSRLSPPPPPSPGPTPADALTLASSHPSANLCRSSGVRAPALTRILCAEDSGCSEDLARFPLGGDEGCPLVWTLDLTALVALSKHEVT